MQRRPNAPATADVLGGALAAGAGLRGAPPKDAQLLATAALGTKKQPWTWSQWGCTLLVPIVVVAAIVVFLPGGADVSRMETEWDGNLTDVGLEVSLDGTFAPVGTEQATQARDATHA